VQARPPFLIALMNYSNGIAAVLMLIPLFFVVKRYWGLGTAVGANLILMLIPVWWQLSRYGHPQLPATLLMFTGLALLCYRSHLASEHRSKAKIFTYDMLITAALSLCLMNRLDAILMFPLIPACLLLEKYSLKVAIYRSFAYSFLPLLIRSAVDAFLPSSSLQAFAASTFHTFWYWHNPVRMVEFFGRANKLFLTAYPPILLLIFIIACLYLARARKYSSLFFVMPVVIINYLFWLPNPFPARHFLYLAPTLSIGIALILSAISEHASSLITSKNSLITSKNLLTHTGTILVFLFASLLVSKFDGIKLYKNLYSSPEQVYIMGRFGKDLQKLPALNGPIFVVAEKYPVLVKMLMEADPKTIIQWPNRVYNGKNEFYFLVSYQFLEGIANFRKKSKEFDEFYWLVDPYNPKFKKILKFYNIEAPPFAKQLDFNSLTRQRSSLMVNGQEKRR
jgi:hypothetical protein